MSDCESANDTYRGRSKASTPMFQIIAINEVASLPRLPFTISTVIMYRSLCSAIIVATERISEQSQFCSLFSLRSIRACHSPLSCSQDRRLGAMSCNGCGSNTVRGRRLLCPGLLVAMLVSEGPVAKAFDLMLAHDIIRMTGPRSHARKQKGTPTQSWGYDLNDIFHVFIPFFSL